MTLYQHREACARNARYQKPVNTLTNWACCSSRALKRERLLVTPLVRRLYFCAWLAICVGVLDVTNWRLMPRQLPWSREERGCEGRAV
jgi:hypothetical protein